MQLITIVCNCIQNSKCIDKLMETFHTGYRHEKNKKTYKGYSEKEVLKESICCTAAITTTSISWFFLHYSVGRTVKRQEESYRVLWHVLHARLVVEKWVFLVHFARKRCFWWLMCEGCAWLSRVMYNKNEIENPAQVFYLIFADERNSFAVMNFIVKTMQLYFSCFINFLDRIYYICYKITACSFFLPKGLFAFSRALLFVPN